MFKDSQNRDCTLKKSESFIIVIVSAVFVRQIAIQILKFCNCLRHLWLISGYECTINSDCLENVYRISTGYFDVHKFYNHKTRQQDAYRQTLRLSIKGLMLTIRERHIAINEAS